MVVSLNSRRESSKEKEEDLFRAGRGVQEEDEGVREEAFVLGRIPDQAVLPRGGCALRCGGALLSRIDPARTMHHTSIARSLPIPHRYEEILPIPHSDEDISVPT